MSARILHPPCHAYIPRPSRPYPLDLSPRLSLLGNPGFRAERSVVCFVSASTCYAPLPALANKLLSGLRADDSVVFGDTHARTHTDIHTRGEEACYDTSLEVNCSASVFGCPFARESWRGKKKEKKRKREKKNASHSAGEE